MSDNLLLDESPIIVYPTLAKALGINNALVLQQLHFLIGVSKKGKDKDRHFIDGRFWVWNTYQQWREDHFIWLSESTIKNCFLFLEAIGVVIVKQSVEDSGDRTKWYTIDYNRWNMAVSVIRQNLSDSWDKNCLLIIGQNLSDLYTETTTETTTDIDSSSANANALRASTLDDELDDLSSYQHLTNHRQAQAASHLTTQSAFNTPHPPSSAKVPSPKADKPPKATRQPKEDLSRYDLRFAAGKPKPTDVIVRAMALYVFEVNDDPLSISSVEGRMTAIIFGQKNPFVVLGLLDYEKRRNNADLNYQGIADAFEGFRAFVRRRKLLEGMYRGPKGFIGYWQEYRNEERKQDERVWD